jgi:hypothetical protein
MQNITTAEGLKDAILLLEIEQDEKLQVLRNQIVVTYEALKPLNLLKRTIHDITTSPDLLENLFGSAMGLTTGLISKKILVGGTGNLMRKLFGTLLQFAVTNIVTRHPDAIKTVGQFIVQTLSRRKEKNSE